jgi:hypothetical protein
MVTRSLEISSKHDSGKLVECLSELSPAVLFSNTQFDFQTYQHICSRPTNTQQPIKQTGYPLRDLVSNFMLLNDLKTMSL